MSQKNKNFSAAIPKLSVPKMSNFIDAVNKTDENATGIHKENIEKEIPIAKEDEVSDVDNGQFEESQSITVENSLPNSNISLELLKQKKTTTRLHFSTSVSEKCLKRLKQMSLALDVNINDLVENAINIAYESNEKEILRLLKKKLL